MSSEGEPNKLSRAVSVCLNALLQWHEKTSAEDVKDSESHLLKWERVRATLSREDQAKVIAQALELKKSVSRSEP